MPHSYMKHPGANAAINCAIELVTLSWLHLLEHGDVSAARSLRGTDVALHLRSQLRHAGCTQTGKATDLKVSSLLLFLL
jgi:hypothetical protein